MDIKNSNVIKRAKVIDLTNEGRLLVSVGGLVALMRRGSASLEENIYSETLENISTNNQILDNYLRRLVEKREKIPQYLQVIDSEEIDSITASNDITEIQREIQDRLTKKRLFRSRISGGYVTGLVLLPHAVPAPYFGQIEEYCIAIGRNSYRLGVYSNKL